MLNSAKAFTPVTQSVFTLELLILIYILVFITGLSYITCSLTLYCILRVYSYPSSGNILKLTIQNVKDTDTGVYTCNGIVDNIPATWKFELQAYGMFQLPYQCLNDF